jgi:hypothetical protein
MPTKPRIDRLLELIVLSTFVVGCSKSQFTVVPVHGKVTVDDKPLSHGTIMFAPIRAAEQKDPGKPALGTIDSNGDYHLTTFSNDDGAVVGDHWATILNVSKDLPKGVPEFDRITFPTKLKVVADRDNEIDIKLTREIIKKYGGDNR